MVDQVNDAPRTRRALLTAAAAASAAVVATAVKPLSALAAVDDNADMFVGTFYNDVSLTTGLRNNSGGAIVFHAVGASGSGVRGESSSASGGAGVVGVNNGTSAGIGVRAAGGAGRAVFADSTGSTAIHAVSNNSPALRAESTSGFGVHCTSSSGIALLGTSSSNSAAVFSTSATSNAAVLAFAVGGSTAVHGHTGSSSADPEPNTGVMGSATGSGTGGFFHAPSAGTALRVAGKATFSRSGKTNIPKNRSYVDIDVPGGLGSSSAVIATLQKPRGTAAVTSVRVNDPSAGKARIYLNKVASTTASTPVGWFVIS